MLLKAGMTIKQAFLCNIMSAFLQLLGTLLGILIGTKYSLWLFSFAAGNLLYIALVDMVRILLSYTNHPC